MEFTSPYQHLAKQKLDSLYEAGADPRVLDQVAPLIAEPNVSNTLVKAAASYEYSQLWWERAENNDTDREELCVSLGQASLTVSIKHLHLNSPFPRIPPEIRADRISLVVEPSGNSLHQTYELRASTPPAIHGDRATEIFQPLLEHSFRALGFQAVHFEVASEQLYEEAV